MDRPDALLLACGVPGQAARLGGCTILGSADEQLATGTPRAPTTEPTGRTGRFEANQRFSAFDK
jgi:hypothetical protein